MTIIFVVQPFDIIIYNFHFYAILGKAGFVS